MIRQSSTVKLLNAATSTGAGIAHIPWGTKRTFQATGATSAGVGAATIIVQVSNDNENWMDMATIELTLSDTPSSDGFVTDAGWKYVRGNIDAISGTNAMVTLWIGNPT